LFYLNSYKIAVFTAKKERKIKMGNEKESKRELPFDCVIMDSEPVEVKNEMSGESCMLPPDAVAVYDTIKGAELLGVYPIMNKGIIWFKKYFPKEYMILLD